MSCPVCLDGFDDLCKVPLVWSCGHVICRQCFDSMHGIRKCAICRMFCTRAPVRVYWPNTKLQETLSDLSSLTTQQLYTIAQLAIICDDVTLLRNIAVTERVRNQDGFTVTTAFRRGDVQLAQYMVAWYVTGSGADTAVLQRWFDESIEYGDVRAIDFIVTATREHASLGLTYDRALARCLSDASCAHLIQRGADVVAAMCHVITSYSADDAHIAHKLQLWKISDKELISMTQGIASFALSDKTPDVDNLYARACMISEAIEAHGFERSDLVKFFCDCISLDWSIFSGTATPVVNPPLYEIDILTDVMNLARETAKTMRRDEWSNMDKEALMACVHGVYCDRQLAFCVGESMVEDETLKKIRIWRYFKTFSESVCQ